MRRRRFLLIAASVAVAGPPGLPSPTAARAKGGPDGGGPDGGGQLRAQWRGVALGAEVRITLYGPPSATGPALADARAALREIEALFSLYDPDSTLSRLNSTGRVAEAPADFMDLIRLADRMHRATGGLFDPTVQTLWQALAQGKAPPPAARLGWDRVKLSESGVALAHGQALTLNGIAQGAATDRVTRALRARGLTRCLVDAGEIGGFGGPWRIGVEDPAQGLVLTRTLRDGAIATSSPAALSVGGRPHILHPAGLRPLWSTVSVEARSAAVADGLSTALCLAPRNDVAAIAARLPGVRRVTLIDAKGNVATL